MIDDSLPVLIRVSIGQEQSVCIAKIVREGERLYARPNLISPSFGAHFPKLELFESDLELIPNIGGGRPSYVRRGLLVLET
jgi:hypothetical protein